MRDLEASLKAEVRRIIKDGWSLFQLVPDHDIGTAHTVLFIDQPFEQCLDYRFIKGSTDYKLEGDLSYADPVPASGPKPDPRDIPVKYQEPKPTSLRVRR